MSVITIYLSSEGQISIPEELWAVHNWKEGQELVAIALGDGILLKPKKPFPETTLAQVAGCLAYDGPGKTLEEMEDAIAQEIKEQWNDCS
ncbi:MAG: AbrB/MazE/SpoVT family DNA-binding domain-containing protein [Merismopedia sp. SIO2A8]|nr:AbrB/MazE/SpoVT family DNA-binding domain-containing protein [Merismopedia sp. SIO2A8]